MNEITKAAKKYKRAVHGKINLECAVKYAKTIGYEVIFFSSCEDKNITLYKLEHLAYNSTAFTYTGVAHIIFIKDSISYTEKLHRILHEIGHIVLNHIGLGTLYLKDSDKTEAEAEAFVYAVLYNKRSRILYLIVCTLIFLILGIVIGYALRPTQTIPAVKNNVSDYAALDTVYVTPSGEKFHRIDCQYAKDKKCIALTRSKAVKKYSPCSKCRP